LFNEIAGQNLTASADKPNFYSESTLDWTGSTKNQDLPQTELMVSAYFFEKTILQ